MGDDEGSAHGFFLKTIIFAYIIIFMMINSSQNSVTLVTGVSLVVLMVIVICLVSVVFCSTNTQVTSLQKIEMDIVEGLGVGLASANTSKTVITQIKSGFSFFIRLVCLFCIMIGLCLLCVGGFEYCRSQASKNATYAILVLSAFTYAYLCVVVIKSALIYVKTKHFLWYKVSVAILSAALIYTTSTVICIVQYYACKPCSQLSFLHSNELYFGCSRMPVTQQRMVQFKQIYNVSSSSSPSTTAQKSTYQVTVGNNAEIVVTVDTPRALELVSSQQDNVTRAMHKALSAVADRSVTDIDPDTYLAALFNSNLIVVTPERPRSNHSADAICSQNSLIYNVTKFSSDEFIDVVATSLQFKADLDSIGVQQTFWARTFYVAGVCACVALFIWYNLPNAADLHKA